MTVYTNKDIIATPATLTENPNPTPPKDVVVENSESPFGIFPTPATIAASEGLTPNAPPSVREVTPFEDTVYTDGGETYVQGATGPTGATSDVEREDI